MMTTGLNRWKQFLNSSFIGFNHLMHKRTLMTRKNSLTFLALIFFGIVSFVDVRHADAIDIALLSATSDTKTG